MRDRDVGPWLESRSYWVECWDQNQKTWAAARAGQGSAACLHLLWLRRFLPEGLGNMRSSSAGRTGQRSVSVKGKIRACTQITVPILQSQDLAVVLLLLFCFYLLIDFFLACSLFSESLALCIVLYWNQSPFSCFFDVPHCRVSRLWPLFRLNTKQTLKPN